MQLVKSIKEWRKVRQTFDKLPCGLVPTMGNLHHGHASLLERSKKENDITILTIFINPTQFNNQSDLQNYPKTFDDDLSLAEKLGVDYVLAPTYEELYPDDYNFRVTENSGYSQQQEGKFRPGHFCGMLTIVLKLLLLTRPTRAYFGEKDFQQLQLVTAMAKAFLLETEIIPCPTIRNSDGLPLSSRNGRLSPDELKRAASFSRLLAEDLPTNEIQSKLQALGFKVDYIEEHEDRRFGAVELGGIRLIDNIGLKI
jgi:pantoate--beta-alanine ligase